MEICLIAGIDINGLIGNGDKIPWKCPGDMRHFKNTTTDHVVILGRKTWESFGSKPLPNRPHIILTRNLDNVDLSRLQENDVVHVVTTVKEAIITARDLDHKNKVFIIGGAEIYKQFLPYADSAIISTIYGQYNGNVYFQKEFYEFFRPEKVIPTADNSFSIMQFSKISSL